MTAGRLADMVDNDESGLGRITQPDQGLAESGHGAGVVFILVVSGVERIDDDDIGLNRTCRVEEEIQAGGGTEHMARDAGIDKESGIVAITDRFAHGGETESKLGSGQFELADQDTFEGRDLKPSVVAAS